MQSASGRKVGPFWFIAMWDDGGSALSGDMDWTVGMVAAAIWNRQSTFSRRHGRSGLKS